MKKIKVHIVFTIMVFMFSCQKESTQDDAISATTLQKESWLTAKLDAKFASSQKQVAAYLFSTEEMKALVETPNIEEVHFVLGYADNTIRIEVIGVDKSGDDLGSVKSTILKELNLTKLNELSISKTNKRTSLLTKHLLLPKDASVWIEAWQKKLNTVSDLDEITSYEGNRFRYFSLESEIIEAMVAKNNKNIGVFLGLNSKGKVTTILIGLDQNNVIKTTTLTSKEAEDVYDGTRPCPPCVESE
ncbi:MULTISPECIES: hypothetical protein [Flavobacterium]|uniref:Lipoprotein n=1 Tax=Flavobacterium salmonis TaxID=2654844 RepID=A0A6V6Z1U2_9FLAO|nr:MULTISPECIES: hypothetical protein [Flavobacterium]OOV18664.1 hypothetical protein BXU10_02905 [Flavobacterium sp. LM4]CAD0005646.1 hypothetical protein FLAT13_02878 [Flavobacterium salmonis]